MKNIETSYLESARKLFQYYKDLGDKTFAQIDDTGIHWRLNPTSNSIAVIVQHVAGNSLSRWTDFLASDGEKEWRMRDQEFQERIKSKEEMIEVWEKGWACLFQALDPLQESDLMRIAYIRNEGHLVVEAINRQLAHLPYHVGQIVFAGKMITDEKWKSLSIPRGKSQVYNAHKFSSDRKDQFFTDGNTTI